MKGLRFGPVFIHEGCHACALQGHVECGGDVHFFRVHSRHGDMVMLTGEEGAVVTCVMFVLMASRSVCVW
jgi:hypothetical protein